MAFSDIYTFGPTLELKTQIREAFGGILDDRTEMAFYDLNDNMNLAEELLQYLIRYALEHNKEESNF